MAYILHAVLASSRILAGHLPWIADSRVIALAQDISMIPVTTPLCEQFGPAERPWLYERSPLCMNLPERLVPDLAELSHQGPVAFVTTEFHGGDGEQCSVVWRDGELWSEPEEGSWAINTALVRLGVRSEPGMDPFTTLGLDRCRSVEDWLAAGL